MSYTLYYTAHFMNEQSQIVHINIFKKDAEAPDSVENYKVIECILTDNSEGQTKYDCIIARELLLTLYTTENDSLTWETFIASTHDEWKIEILVDDQYYFQGFITPDEGNAPFFDKPYEVTFRATNGLALLKNISLSKVNGDNFDDEHTLIEYIAGALAKTGLELPIRIYCGYFNADMNHKGHGLQYDMFNQVKLDYRTFMRDATTYVNCYEALKIILDKFCTLEYWNGKWVIASIAEKQYIPYDRFYVDYDHDGTNPTGAIDTNNYGRIGKGMELYPINENQIINSRFALKSVRTQYDYELWPELPRNNNFEFGNLISEVINPDGTITREYTINNWTLGGWTSNPTPLTNLPALNPPGGTARAYRKSTYNIYNIEIEREIWVGGRPATDISTVLQSDKIPVRAGDKFELQFEFKKNFFDDGTYFFAAVYIKPYSGTWPNDGWSLDNNNSTQQDGGPLFWSEFGSVDFLSRFYDNGENVGNWHSITLDPPAIPVDGDMYIWLLANNPSSSNFSVYRNFRFTYKPFVAGGYIQVKGDYWLRSQSANYPDTVEEPVRISDSVIKPLKGAMLFDGTLTNPSWYRFGYIGNPNPFNESRHFKELLNLARFNHSYRRMYALEGEFNGLNYAADNNPTQKMPINFFTTYMEVDMNPPRQFVLVPPLTMDLGKGWIHASLVEVKKDSNDGTQQGTAEFKYIF